MSRYKDSNKYKIYGEDAILAARFDKYLDATLRNCRADYLKALSKRKQREIPYEDLPDAEKETVQESSAADDEIESLLFWEALKTHLHLLNPKECEVMIGLYVKRFLPRKLPRRWVLNLLRLLIIRNVRSIKSAMKLWRITNGNTS